MLYRSRATLGPIIEGLLAAGLCTLAAAAQQPAPAASVQASAPLHAPAAKTKETASPAADASSQDSAGSADNTAGSADNTGVSHPEEVTPDTSGDQDTVQPASAPASQNVATPGTKAFPTAVAKDPEDKPAADTQQFAPDQPPTPVTPDHDSDKPTPVEPPVQTPPQVAAPSNSADTSAPQPTQQPPAQAPQESAPAPSAAGTNSPASSPSTPDKPANPDAPATSPTDAGPPAPQQNTPSAPATPVPDSSTPQQASPAAADNTASPAASDTNAQPPAPTAPASTTPASTTPADAPAPQQNTPAAPATPAPDSSTPQAPPAAAPAAAPDTNAPLPASTAPASTTPASPTPADTTAPQQNTPAAPSTPAPDSSTPQQTAPAAADNTASPAAPDTNAQPPAQPASTAPASTTPADTTAPQQNAPAAPSTPAPDSSTPQQSAPAAAPDSGAAPAPTPPPADTNAQPTAPAPADSSAPQQNAPAAPTTPGPDAATPQQSAPATQPDTTGQAGTPAPAAPPAPETAPASEPGSAAPSQTAAPQQTPQDQAPASTSDNSAVNPSLPAQQVNEPEPPPASRIDIFGGYAYLRPSGSVGTWNFPTNNTRGYIASGTYYFSRHFGVQAEFSHSEYPLGTTGTSPAPPFVQLGGVTDRFYTAEAGGVYRFFFGQHFIPFVHFIGGGAQIAGPKFQPPTWGYGIYGGGGMDVLLPHTGEHVAFRLVQADYGYMHADQGALQPYDLAGGSQDVSALRLSAGLVIRLGEMNPIPSKSLACDATPAEVYAGERVTVAATLRNYKDRTKHPFAFSWVLTGGKQQGFGPVIFIDTTGLAAGTYHATAHISLKEKGKQFAQCSANYVVKESPAPTLKCSPDPSTVTPGQVSIITAYAGSIPQRKLTYSYTTSEGQINGKQDTAELHTDGLPPGVANVTCRIDDDLGRTAVAMTTVTIAPPALPPAPKAQPLCTVYFNRDMRRPARVDNEGRACLDDIALTMEHQPDARLVLIGEHSDSEADGQLTAAERAINTRAYLANEKGIDPSRVDVRTSTTPGRQVQTYLLAPGAVFDQPTEGQIDESKVKIHGQQYAHQKMRTPQKGPVGEGVSHPPKN